MIQEGCVTKCPMQNVIRERKHKKKQNKKDGHKISSCIKADKPVQRFGLHTHNLPIVEIGTMTLPHIDVQYVLENDDKKS